MSHARLPATAAPLTREPPRWRDWASRGMGLSPWGISLAAHFLGMLALGLAWPGPSRKAVPVETPHSSIVLAARHDGLVRYLDPRDDAAEPLASNPTGRGTTDRLLAALPGDIEQPSAARAWPAPAEQHANPPLAGADGLRVSERGLPGPGGAAALRGRDGSAETELFGLRGRGTRFVYVIDRSASMQGLPLAAARRELIASLQPLQATHQFQIIFYNQQPRIMSVHGGLPQLVFADEEGKRLAASFLEGIFAEGGTDHMRALELALRLVPDVLFFLTDGDEPQLHTTDLRRIRGWNRGTVLHAIEFGVGPSSGRESFLARLAWENGGQYTYVDVTRLGH